MKKQFFVLLITAYSLGAFAQTKGEPYLVKSLTNESIKTIEAKTSGGSISVSGAGGESRIEVYVSGNNDKQLSKEEIQQRLAELYDLDINVSGGKLSAIAKSKGQIRDWKKALNIAYKIFVPGAVSTDLTTSGGSINLENLSGTQKFSTSGGSLSLRKLSGSVNGATSGGSIELDDSRDEINLTTSGGSIRAANCDGNMKLSTSGGSLHFSNLKGNIDAATSGGNVEGEKIAGELKAHTSGGSIRMNDLSCSLETSTSGGNIDVAFAQVGKYIKVHNSAGSVVLSLPKNAAVDLDLSGDISNTSFENFSGKIDERMVKGKLNGGGIPVSIGASSGSIKLQLK